MAVTPADSLSIPLNLLRETLAASATFQTLVGAADAPAAKRHIRFFGVDRPAPWPASTAVALGQCVLGADVTGFVYECSAAGTTGAAAPTWPTVDASTVTESGGVEWTARAVHGGGGAWMNEAIRLARPFAVVSPGDEFSFAMNASGPHNWFGASGRIELAIEADVPDAYADSTQDAGLWFTNLLGAILDDLRALAGTTGYLNIVGFSQRMIGRTAPQDIHDLGDAFLAVFEVEWRGAP